MLSVLVIAMATTSPTPHQSAAADSAVIDNSGSTNTAPYTITVRPDGTARVEISPGHKETKKLADATTAAFFKDLHAALPLGELETAPCMKSASFGTRTTVRYRGATSPDLSCAMDERGKRLAADVAKIAQELQIFSLRRYDGLRNTHMIAQPSPTPPK